MIFLPIAAGAARFRQCSGRFKNDLGQEPSMRPALCRGGGALALGQRLHFRTRIRLFLSDHVASFLQPFGRMLVSLRIRPD
jgi:hypothetical protein